VKGRWMLCVYRVWLLCRCAAHLDTHRVVLSGRCCRDGVVGGCAGTNYLSACVLVVTPRAGDTEHLLKHMVDGASRMVDRGGGRWGTTALRARRRCALLVRQRAVRRRAARRLYLWMARQSLPHHAMSRSSVRDGDDLPRRRSAPLLVVHSAVVNFLRGCTRKRQQALALG
jgi:hypothetical protein